MRYRQELYVCAITHLPMRHPAIVIDNEGHSHNYEFSAIAKSVQSRGAIDPQTRNPILFIAHNSELEKLIDSDPESTTDRPEEYMIQAHLEYIKKRLTAPPIVATLADQFTFFKRPAVRSIEVFFGTYLTIVMLYHHLHFSLESPSQEHIRDDVANSYAIPFSFAAGLFDYGIRHLTDNRYSLPSTVFNIVRNLIPTSVVDNARNLIVNVNHTINQRS